jgi:prevent-host-death family protein
MSVREARARFADVLGSVYHTGEPVIVERNGKPVAVLISPDAFVSGKAGAREEPSAALDDAALAALLARAPAVRALFERPALKAQGRSTEEMIALAREEAWTAKRTSNGG